MDTYRDILDRLSCLSLSKALEMPHDTVFRAAFFIESSTVRLSNKNQKKFAILVISDGYDACKLPIWSELYEEKSHLLNANQLLYAVLQVDKREATPRLSCKWVDDLTKANEAMIGDCDQAFDKIKMQVQRFAQMKNQQKPDKVVEPAKVSVAFTPYAITLDLKKTPLSIILKLKELFSKHRGKNPVNLEFHGETHQYATMQIEGKWGVNVSDAFKEDLESILK